MVGCAVTLFSSFLTLRFSDGGLSELFRSHSLATRWGRSRRGQDRHSQQHSCCQAQWRVGACDLSLVQRLAGPPLRQKPWGFHVSRSGDTASSLTSGAGVRSACSGGATAAECPSTSLQLRSTARIAGSGVVVHGRGGSWAVSGQEADLVWFGFCFSQRSPSSLSHPAQSQSMAAGWWLMSKERGQERAWSLLHQAVSPGRARHGATTVRERMEEDNQSRTHLLTSAGPALCWSLFRSPAVPRSPSATDPPPPSAADVGPPSTTLSPQSLLWTLHHPRPLLLTLHHPRPLLWTLHHPRPLL